MPTLRPTRKVAVSGILSAALAIVAAGLYAITPDMLTALGVWVPVAMAVIVTAANYLTPNGPTN